jgi:hypothetical protein
VRAHSAPPKRVMSTQKRGPLSDVLGNGVKRRRVVFTNGETVPTGITSGEIAVNMHRMIMTGSNRPLDEAIRTLCYNGINNWQRYIGLGESKQITDAVRIITANYGDVEWVIDGCERLAGLATWFHS